MWETTWARASPGLPPLTWTIWIPSLLKGRDEGLFRDEELELELLVELGLSNLLV